MRRQRGALDRPVILAAVMKNKIPRITIGTDLGDKSHAICVLDKAGEIIASMLLTWHNLHYYQELMAGLREAIAAGRLEAFAADFAAMRAEGDLEPA